MDLLEGLNKYRPHVAHFSRHANSLGPLMENDEGTTEGDNSNFVLLARLVGATEFLLVQLRGFQPLTFSLIRNW